MTDRAAEIRKRWGKAVRVERVRQDLRQEDLALAIGCDQSIISDIERGVIGLSLERQLQIAEALKVGADDLFTIEEGVA